MQTTTLIQCTPAEFSKVIIQDLLQQLGGTHPAGTAAIPVEQLPLFSAQQAADYLNCSIAHINTLVSRYPELLKPIIIVTKDKKGNEKSSAIKYEPKQLYHLKSNNLVK